MTSLAFALLVAATSGVAPGAVAPDLRTPRVASDLRTPRVALAQLTIQQRVVIRVPMAPMSAAAPRPTRWLEKKGPKCVPATSLAGAFVSGPNIIDLHLRNGPRLRAQLDSQCNAVDLRFGFYIRPHPDGQICADRDTIHARTGAQCEIQRFKSLAPER